MGTIARKLIMRGWKSVAVSDAEIRAGQTAPSGVLQEKNMAYLGDGAAPHLLDVCYPADVKGLLPVILDIHGGSWVYGTKELNEYYCMSLAKLGFAVISMNYTLAPEAHIDAQIREIFGALKWVDKNGDKHRCDKDKVFIVGDSSGGQLAALAAVVDATPILQSLYGVKKLPFDIRAVGVSCGMFDLSAMFGRGILMRELGRMILGSRPERSPFFGHVSITDVVASGNCPPMHIVTSEGDKGLHQQSVDMAAMLADRGVMCELYDVKGEDADSCEHVFNVMYWNTPFAEAANKSMADFFQKLM